MHVGMGFRRRQTLLLINVAIDPKYTCATSSVALLPLPHTALILQCSVNRVELVPCLSPGRGALHLHLLSISPLPVEMDCE